MTTLSQAIDKAFTITQHFEGGNGYTNLSGSFDGMGISAFMVQWNLGQGTLQPLLLEMHNLSPDLFKTACTVFVKQYNKVMDLSADLLKVCTGMTNAQAVKWAEQRQNSKFQLLPHWVQAFNNLGRTALFQALQRKRAKKLYMDPALAACKKFGFKTERAVALLYDIHIQMGSVSLASKARYLAATTGRKMTEQEKLIALATAVGPQGGKWKADVLSRKLCIASGKGTVHGRQYDLARDYNLGDDDVL